MTIISIAGLAECSGKPPAAGVPEWALGSVLRRSITFATGFEDRQTFAAWVQAHTMTGDIRVHPARPKLTAADRLEDLDLETLVLLASVEGGVAATSWDAAEQSMSWADWIGFQPYDKYPEPGLMKRAGDCMIEFAPSGAYVEDWRFQPSRAGVLAGLRLVSETDSKGETRPRQGGMAVAGDHAICVLGRRQPIPVGQRAQDYVRAAADPVAALRAVLDCSVDYIHAGLSGAAIAVSTDPRREGRPFAWSGQLVGGSDATSVVERTSGEDGTSSRLWTIESIESKRTFDTSTAMPPGKRLWLSREADTLIAPVLAAQRELARCAS